MATVFVVQDSGNKNLAPCMDLGNIKVLASRDLPLFGNPGPALNKMKKDLETYDPSQDYLVPAGDPLLIGAAMSFIAMRFGKVRCLKWDRQSERYLFIELPLAALPRCTVG